MTNTLQKIEAQPSELVAQSQAASLLDVVARAASDPNVDIDKLERLILLQERVTAREAETSYYAAMAELQPNLPVIAERGEIKGRGGEVMSTYARWEDINEAIRPVLSEYGFSLTFKTQRTDNEVIVTGIVAHRGGHKESTVLSMPTDTSGAKNNVQGVGSSTSYGKRYTAIALLNLTSCGEDDDGYAAGRGQLINQEQYSALQQKIDETQSDEVKFCEALKVPDLTQLPAGRFDEAIRLLNRKAQKNQQAAQ